MQGSLCRFEKAYASEKNGSMLLDVIVCQSYMCRCVYIYIYIYIHMYIYIYIHIYVHRYSLTAGLPQEHVGQGCHLLCIYIYIYKCIYIYTTYMYILDICIYYVCV